MPRFSSSRKNSRDIKNNKKAATKPKKNLKKLWYNIANFPEREQDELEHSLVEDDELGVAETYSDYMPSKLKLGKKHPDPVVETASLSSVEPTDIWYQLTIPEKTIDSGALSALQLESITYSCQAHEHILPDGTRAGFLIGDGAGVGKGRTIAGVIFENYLKGREKAIWVSVSNDLKYDAERDFADIGAGKINVHQMNKFKYAPISSAENGNVKNGVIFSTYSALIGKTSMNIKCKTRLEQLLQWCGEDFDGLIVFDECHRAKNLCPTEHAKPTKTGVAVLELQNKLPKARVVYASATGASEPRNMAYMVRLGLWGEGTPFKGFIDFLQAMESGGVGAMEVVAMDMKLRGMYIARQLSFHGVTFRIEEVPLSKEYQDTYDTSAQLWVNAMEKFTEAANLICMDNTQRKHMWGQFWSAHQRFFKYLCIAAKVSRVVEVAHEAIAAGKCVVVGLQSTGEARTLEQLEREDGELTDFVSTTKAVFENLIKKQFPVPDRSKRNKDLERQPHISLLNINKPKKIDSAYTASGKRKMIVPDELLHGNIVKRQKRACASNNSKYVISDDGSDSSDSWAPSDDSDIENHFKSAKELIENGSSKEDKKVMAEQKFLSNTTSEAWTPSGDYLNSENPFRSAKELMEIGSLKEDRKVVEEQKPLPKRNPIDRVYDMQNELLEKLESLNDRLPPNTLDQLILELGGSNMVAEMTGRKGRLTQICEGNVQYESRSEKEVSLETINLTEKQRFMDGDKDIAIISEAASSGISLQSDRRAKNQKRRVHITLELPWSADRAIQQFGRTHRSNQVNAPEYVFLITDLAGERRFASAVAKRMESLGALTHADRRATEATDLSQFNVDNKYGRQALDATLKAVNGRDIPMLPAPKDYEGEFFKDVREAALGVGLLKPSELQTRLTKEYVPISKFLNRILGMPVDLQNRLFRYFADTLDAIISRAKREGHLDLGILDLGAGGELVTRVRTVTFLRKHVTGTAPTELHTVHVERGISWSEALQKTSQFEVDHRFYISRQLFNGHHTVILAIAINDNPCKKSQLYHIYRPNTGQQFRKETGADLDARYRKVEAVSAMAAWNQLYDSTLTMCSHTYWKGSCFVGQNCEVGKRRRTYNVVSGSVLSVWSRMEKILESRNIRMQVVRLKTGDGLKVVGTLIPKNSVERLIEDLSLDAEEVDDVLFQ